MAAAKGTLSRLLRLQKPRIFSGTNNHLQRIITRSLFRQSVSIGNYNRHVTRWQGRGIGAFVKNRAPVKNDDVNASDATKCWRCRSVIVVKNSFVCEKCEALLPPKEQRFDYFEILNVSRTYDVDVDELTRNFRELQRKFHPDKFSNKSKIEQEYSAIYSSWFNKAYQTLLKPLLRGMYILDLHGKSVEDGDIDMGGDFLMAMMEINERLETCDSLKEIQEIDAENLSKLCDLNRKAVLAFANENWDSAKKIMAKMKYFDNIDGKVKEKELELTK